MKLALRGVSKSFHQAGAELKILAGLDLELKAGEIVAVVGQSGSGKSTLLSLLAGFETADRGEIFWDQQPSTAWSESQWAAFRKANLGFVFQNYYLIPYLTALENVALPCRLLGQVGAEDRAQNLLTSLGLGERLDHLPSQLSGGECQRVAIARAMIHQPQLVLADEPTGSLDVQTGSQVLDLFFHLLKQRQQTALIVTHSAEVAERCDRVLTLKAGQLWSR